MAPTSDRPLPLGPLNPGNVVSAALRLYRDRFKTYAKIAVVAYLWLLLGLFLLGVIPAILFGFFGAMGNEILLGLGVLVGILVGLFPLLYGIAKYSLNSALLARLAFHEIISQPETVEEAHQQLEPKLWSFLWLGVLLLLLYFAAYFVFGVLALIAGFSVGGLVYAVVATLAVPSTGIIFGTLLGVLVGLLLFVIGLVWIISRIFIAEVPVAVENVQAGDGISRSWQLTKASVVRIQLVVMAAFLMTVPIVAITNYLPQILLVGLETGSAAYWMIYSLSLVFSFLGGILVLPFWQSVKGVLYYDLRSRREGLDLQLRDQPPIP